MTSHVPSVAGVQLQPPPGITPASLLKSFGTVGNVISRAFEMMAVAEEVISDYCKRFPDHKKNINQAFPILRWCSENTISDDFYRSHVSELIERVIQGHQVGLPTTAELIMVVHYTSLKAPLNTQFTVLYEDLFQRALPGNTILDDRILHQEQWSGATQEAEAEVVRKLLPLTKWRDNPEMI